MAQVRLLWLLLSVLSLQLLFGYYLVCVDARLILFGIPSPWIVSFGTVLFQITVLTSLGTIAVAGHRHRPTERCEPFWIGAAFGHMFLMILFAAGQWLTDAHPRSGRDLFSGLLMAMMASPGIVFSIGVLVPELGWAVSREEDETSPLKWSPPAGAIWNPLKGLGAAAFILFVMAPDFAGLMEHGLSVRRFGEIGLALLAAGMLAYSAGWNAPEHTSMPESQRDQA